MAIEFALHAPAPKVELSDRLLVTPARLLCLDLGIQVILVRPHPFLAAPLLRQAANTIKLQPLVFMPLYF